MNFFKHQDDARRKSAQLVFLLAAAVAALIVITTLALTVLLYFLESNSTSIGAYDSANTSLFAHFKLVLSSELILWIATGVIAVVCIGSLYKSSQLKRGGDYVAQALGGKILLHEQADANEKKLLNIVEEMAIASGMPVPRVYLMDETAINAFAAGTNTSNAVIGITKGCIEKLNREQLQGVIAHEFSHIHHGDMRLNMRLIAVLHGILLIGLIGEVLLRSSSRRSYHSSRSKKGNNGAIIGLALMAIGFGGVFFGNIIKAAVSRQREFLADASAVQYTRNPQGIAAALLKIKKSAQGSNLSSKNAAEFSHFFFANGVSSFFSRMFATHPPLNERIVRVYPAGPAELENLIDKPRPSAQQTTESFNADAERKAGAPSSAPVENGAATETGSKLGLDNLIAHAGEINPLTLDYSHILLASIPLTLQEACSSPYQARAIAYALLLDHKDEIKQAQIEYLQKRAHPATFKEFLRLLPLVETSAPELKFPILQLAQPALMNLSEPQQRIFSENLHALAKADNKLSLREWSVLSYLLAGYQKPRDLKPKKLNELKESVIAILSFSSLLNETSEQQAGLNAAIQQIWPEETGRPEKLSLDQLNHHLDILRQLNPMQKPMFLKALAHGMCYDGNFSAIEKDVLRTMAAVLEAPLPVLS